MATTTGVRRRISVRSVVLLVLGLALLVLSFRTLTWYAVDDGVDSAGVGFAYADLRDNADQLAAPVASAYFDWLAWALVVVIVIVGVVRTVTSRFNDPLRVVGFLGGFAGAAATCYALAQLFDAQQAAGGADHGVLHNSTLGMWSAVIGFLFAGAGAAARR